MPSNVCYCACVESLQGVNAADDITLLYDVDSKRLLSQSQTRELRTSKDVQSSPSVTQASRAVCEVRIWRLRPQQGLIGILDTTDMMFAVCGV